MGECHSSLHTQAGEDPEAWKPSSYSLDFMYRQAHWHMVLDHLKIYVEDGNLSSSTVFVFLSISLCSWHSPKLKHKFMCPPVLIFPNYSSILGINLMKTFKNVSCAAILDNLNYFGGGAYLQLHGRFSDGVYGALRVRERQHSSILLDTRGTPQVAVLSSFPFDTTLCRLPGNLSTIPGLHHS